MAQNLFLLGQLLAEESLIERSGAMVAKVADRVVRHPSGFSGWGSLMLCQNLPFYQIAVVGSNAGSYIKEITARYRPDTVIAGSQEPSDSPLFRGRYVEGKTLIYQCSGNTCGLPVESPEKLNKVG